MAGAAAAAAPSVGRFLRSARRRWLLRRGLQALLAAVAVNYLLLAAVNLANRALGLRLPALATGLLVALALIAGAALRARPARIAREADRALGLKDRLASFLDLGPRADVDGRYRDAQAAETAAALARVDPRRAIRLPRWLWVAPPLFLAMVYHSHLATFLPQPLRWVRQARIFVAGGPGGPAGDADAPLKIVSTAPSAAGDAAGGPGQPPQPAPAPQTEQPAPTPPPPGQPHPDAAHPGQQGGTAAAPPRGAFPAGAGGGGGAASMPQPARLFSAPVGAALTPVREGLPPATGAVPAAAPRGRVAFNLVPGRGAGAGAVGPGSGQGTGTEEGLSIVVDFAALSPEVRDTVRRYFDTLSTLFTGGSLGTRH